MNLFVSCFHVLVHYFLALAVASAAAAKIGGNETDHLALIDIKAKIGDPFGVLRSWNASTHFCNWTGVSCTSRRHHQRVTILDLSSSKLTGSIPPNIGNLSFLYKVDLGNNSFTDQIPPELGLLHRVQILRLDHNALQGKIPSFPNMSTCSFLDISHNKLVEEIPVELGSLLNLRFLLLNNNNLTGNIPSSLGNLSSLEELYLTKNHLNGSIPDSLGQLRNLTVFSLADNWLSNKIPPSIFNLSSIRVFELTLNRIHGSLPSDIATTFPNLKFFSIAHNKFTGSIPISFSNASNLRSFQFTENKFSGTVPSLEKLHKLQRLSLAGNYLGSGGAEPEDLIFLCSLGNATSLNSLYIDVNNFGGALPDCITNLSQTILHLALDENKIFGRIPAGMSNLVNLEMLEMQNNQLSGDIPLDFGKLVKLQFMALHENNLSGSIPSSFGNLKLLSELYLHGNKLQGVIPSSLGECQKLRVLILSSNNLSGSIPVQIFGISSLAISLDLSRNKLSGTLPMEIKKLKNTNILDVSDNLLSGEIPSGLGSCVQLAILKLSGNFFHGSIPSTFSSLRSIEYLDLSRNKLVDNIPSFFEGFDFIQILNLSYNNFEGMVPTEGVFKNASATLVAGNNKLCGGIPELQLPKCNSRAPNKFLTFLVKLIAPVSGFLVVCFTLCLFFLCYFRKNRIGAKSTSTSTSSKEFYPKVSYQALLKATDGFSTANMLGMGGFGSVYKGILHESQTAVAVKVFNLLRPGSSKSFMAECEALRNLRHRNLVKVLTICSGIDHSGNEFKALVYEFMVSGSLEEWLHSGESPRMLNLVQRLNVMIDVASALDYLHHHHHQSPVVHCDLKPSNVLLDGDLVGHVGDFGLARFLQDVRDKESSFIGIKGSIGYTAPEYGMGGELSTQGDVYSYGILMLEVLTGKRPSDDMFQGNSNLHNFVDEALPERAAEILDPILVQEVEAMVTRNTLVLKCLVSIFGIGVACSVDLPSERLSMEDVVIQLSTVRSNLLAI